MLCYKYADRYLSNRLRVHMAKSVIMTPKQQLYIAVFIYNYKNISDILVFKWDKTILAGRFFSWSVYMSPPGIEPETVCFPAEHLDRLVIGTVN